MSIHASNHVWTLKLENATRKLVLLRFADHAHDDGTAAWCGIRKVAEFAECDERTAKRHVKWLVEHGHMREGDQRHVDHIEPRRRPIVYDLAMSEATRREWEAMNAAGVNGRREAAKVAGARGAAASAQVRRGDKMSPHDLPSTGAESTGDKMSPHSRGDSADPSGVTNQAEWGDTGVTQTTQETIPKNHPSSTSATADAAADADDDTSEAVDEKNDREDVARVCNHLRDRIVANGCKEPTITKRWRDAARLLMDTDGRSERQVHNMIDWCQDDEFWRSNILSMPKLREKYEQMRLKALADPKTKGMRRGYDDVATWGKAEEEPTSQPMSDEEIDALFAGPRTDLPPSKHASNG